MKYMNYWFDQGTSLEIAISTLFSFAFGDAINNFVRRAFNIDSFLLTTFIGVGTICFIWIIAGYQKMQKQQNPQ